MFKGGKKHKKKKSSDLFTIKKIKKKEQLTDEQMKYIINQFPLNSYNKIEFLDYANRNN